MKGLTSLEVSLLRDAADPYSYETKWSPEMNEAVIELCQRRLVELKRTTIRECSGPYIIAHDVMEGVITSLGRLVLSIVLTEPSLVRPHTP